MTTLSPTGRRIREMTLAEFRASFPPMMGAEEPDADHPETTQGAPEGTSAENPTSEFFSEGFDPQQLDEPLRQRYSQMQADYTRKTQELAEQRRALEQSQSGMSRELEIARALQSDPDQALRAMAEHLGYELDDDELEDLDPEEALQHRVDQLEQGIRLQQEQAMLAQQEQEEIDLIDSALEAAQQSEGREFDDGELEFIVARALQARDANGVPDVQGAVQALNGVYSAAQQRWLKSKRAAPSAPGSGVPGQEKFDPSNPESRIARMKALMEAEGDGS